MADLKPNEVEKAKLHFDIYDFEGVGKVDAFNLPQLIRSLDLRPTNAALDKAGAAKKKGKLLNETLFLQIIDDFFSFAGEKMLTVEEFLPIYSQLKKDKDIGAYEDLVEGLKVYDKNENGTMMSAELAHTLLMLGEKLTDEEVEDIMKECAGADDEEGYMKYEDFIKKLLAGPFPSA